MKTKLFLFIIVITALFKVPLLFAQDVFPKSDAIWVIHMYKYLGSAGEQFIYGLSGDTIINDLTYQKLYLLNDSTLNIDHQDIYVAGIRQIDKQVWIQPANKKDGSRFNEYLMYDFGKNVGEDIIFINKPYVEIWKEPTFENIDVTLKEQSSATVLQIIETSLAKSYYITDNISYIDTWIEGVGSCSGLFFHPPLRVPTCCGFLGTKLICMKEKDKIKYLDSNCKSCFSEEPLSISMQEMNTNASVIYNNLSNTLEIQTESFPFLFRLISIDGCVVLTQQIVEESTFINLNNIPRGIYIYNIKGENFNQSAKLILK